MKRECLSKERQFWQLYEIATKNNSKEKFIYHTYYGLELEWFKGKRILDVGAGSGLKTLCYAIFGQANCVTGIDEYRGEGSSAENKGRIRSYVETLDLKNVTIVVDDLMKHKFKPNEFDVIIATDTLHHIYSNHIRASKSKHVFLRYLKILQKIYSYLDVDGILCVKELQKYSFSQLVPIWKNPIYWKDKQMASDWMIIMAKAGFRDIKLTYYVPYKVRKMKLALNNWLANYLLKATYTITARK